MLTFTPEEKLACIEREIRMRLKTYPRWVAAGNMTQKNADREIAVMKAIAEDYSHAQPQQLDLVP